MLIEHNGEAAVEYIVLAALIIALLGGTLYAVFNSIRGVLQEVNVEIGS